MSQNQLEMFSRERNRKVYQHWCLIHDIIGSAKLWPKYIPKLFWTRHMDRYQYMYGYHIVTRYYRYINGQDKVDLPKVQEGNPALSM